MFMTVSFHNHTLILHGPLTGSRFKWQMYAQGAMKEIVLDYCVMIFSTVVRKYIYKLSKHNVSLLDNYT